MCQPLLPGSGGQDLKRSSREPVLGGVEGHFLAVRPLTLSCAGSPNPQTPGAEFNSQSSVSDFTAFAVCEMLKH